MLLKRPYYVVYKTAGSGVKQALVGDLAVPLIIMCGLRKWPNLWEPQFLYLQNRYDGNLNADFLEMP